MGADHALAVIGDSPSLPRREMTEAVAVQAPRSPLATKSARPRRAPYTEAATEYTDATSANHSARVPNAIIRALSVRVRTWKGSW